MVCISNGFAACIGNGERIAPCVIDIPRKQVALGVVNLIHVAGKGAADDVVCCNACRVFILDAAQHAERIVSIPQNHAVRAFFAQQLPVYVPVFRRYAVSRLFKPQAVNVVFICVLLAVLRQRRQLPSHPRHRHAVAVGQRIADLIIRDALPVVGRHQAFHLTGTKDFLEMYGVKFDSIPSLYSNYRFCKRKKSEVRQFSFSDLRNHKLPQHGPNNN